MAIMMEGLIMLHFYGSPGAWADLLWPHEMEFIFTICNHSWKTGMGL